MPQIKVTTHTMTDVSNKLKLSSVLLLGQAAAVKAVGLNLPFSANISADIRKALSACSSNIIVSRKRVLKMADSLNAASKLYARTELKRCTLGMNPLELFCSWLVPLIAIGAGGPIIGAWKGGKGGRGSFFDIMPGVIIGKAVWNDVKNNGDGYILGENEKDLVKGTFYGLPYGITATGGLGYHYGKHDWKSGIKYKNGKLEFAGIEGTAEGGFSLLRGKVKGSLGNADVELEGKVGNVSGKGGVGATLFKDGKLNPQLYAELKGKANVLEGSAKFHQGSDALGRETELKGEVLTAEGTLEGGIGRITITDENGNESTQWGAKGIVGGEAYVAKGSIDQSVTIFGIKVNASVGGGVGGVGGKAGGYVTAGGATGTFGLGLGVGADVTVGVDWSGFSLDAVNDTFKEAGEFIDKSSKFVSGTINGIGNYIGGFFH